MTRRRTLLTAISAGTAGVAGCLGILGGGGTEETGEQETIGGGGGGTDTGTPTTRPTTAVSTQETLAPATDAGTEGGTDAPGTDAPGTDPTGTPEPSVDFNVLVDGLSTCGRTCRTLTYTVQNRGDADAGDVSVTIRLVAGGDTVYEGSQSIGDVDARRKRQATTRISLDDDAAAAIRGAGGAVTIETTATAAGGASESFSAERTIEVATATPTATSVEGVGFNVILNEITKCGTTCRTMDYTVQNVGNEDASGVAARITVYTPDLDGEQVYENTQDIGDLGAQTERDAIKDIDTGLVDGRTIQDNDGAVVIRVNLSSAGGATGEFTFDETLDV